MLFLQLSRSSTLSLPSYSLAVLDNEHLAALGSWADNISMGGAVLFRRNPRLCLATLMVGLQRRMGIKKTYVEMLRLLMGLCLKEYKVLILECISYVL